MLYAKKSYGQHFLKQPAVLGKIVQLIASHQFKNVLEIGPGKGALTKSLCKTSANFIAIEADQDMAEYLIQENILSQPQLIRADVLKYSFDNLFEGDSFLLCGNFPYNISSQILIKTLVHTNRIPIMIGMFQKEVVQRIISPPGNKDYGTLSVLTQLMYNGKKKLDIEPSAFSPPPKVHSSVLELIRKDDFLSEKEFIQLQKLVRASFQFRRKTLRNNLKSYVRDQSILSEKYFDRRPEDLSPQEYLKLLHTLDVQK